MERPIWSESNSNKNDEKKNQINTVQLNWKASNRFSAAIPILRLPKHRTLWIGWMALGCIKPGGCTLHIHILYETWNKMTVVCVFCHQKHPFCWTIPIDLLSDAREHALRLQSNCNHGAGKCMQWTTNVVWILSTRYLMFFVKVPSKSET